MSTLMELREQDRLMRAELEGGPGVRGYLIHDGDLPGPSIEPTMVWTTPIAYSSQELPIEHCMCSDLKWFAVRCHTEVLRLSNGNAASLSSAAPI
jgi:hypothetical protein